MLKRLQKGKEVQLLGRKCRICTWEHGVELSEAQLMGATLAELSAWAKTQTPPLTLNLPSISRHRKHVRLVSTGEGTLKPIQMASDHCLIDGVRKLAFQIIAMYDGHLEGIRATDVKLLQVAVLAVLGRKQLEGISSFDTEMRELVERAKSLPQEEADGGIRV